MNVNFTGPERVLYKITFEHALNVEKLTHQQAQEKAMAKILNKRALVKKLNFKH